MSRRANHLDLWEGSDEKFILHTRTGNASVTGIDFGFWRFEYNNATQEYRVSLYADKDDADPVAQSAELDATLLPDTVDLAEYGGSGVTASVFVDGVRGIVPAQTFFAGGDFHFKDDGTTDARNAAQVAAINALPGTAYPGSEGNKVAPPRAVLNAGDTSHGGTHVLTAWPNYVSAYGRYGWEGGADYPMHEIRGGHDLSGPNGDYVKDAITARQGAPQYVLDWDNLRVIMCDWYPGYDQCTIAWLTAQLEAVGTSYPVVIAMHPGFDGFDDWTQEQMDAFLAAIVGYNVIAIIHGHNHSVSFYTESGWDVYRCGSPADDLENHNSILVFKVTSTNLYVNEWEWHTNRQAWGDSDSKAI
jgi:hypothetical protein